MVEGGTKGLYILPLEVLGGDLEALVYYKCFL